MPWRREWQPTLVSLSVQPLGVWPTRLHSKRLQRAKYNWAHTHTHTHTLQIMWPTLDMYSSHIPFKFLEESRHYKKNYSTFCIDSFSCFSLGYSKSCEQTLCNYVLPAKGVALTRWTWKRRDGSCFEEVSHVGKYVFATTFQSPSPSG